MELLKNITLGRVRAVGALLTAILAAVLYCSWPLGYVLNPTVGRNSLASMLQAPHQPYDWFFIATDVASGALAVLLGYLQLRRRRASWTMKIAVVSYVLFGILAVGAALIPISCDPTSQRCGLLIRDPLLLLHGFCSIASVAALFASLLAAAYALRKVAMHQHALGLLAVLLGVCWTAFAVASLLELGKLLPFPGNITEYYFITVCSISLVYVAGTVEYAARRLALAPIPISRRKFARR